MLENQIWCECGFNFDKNNSLVFFGNQVDFRGAWAFDTPPVFGQNSITSRYQIFLGQLFPFLATTNAAHKIRLLNQNPMKAVINVEAINLTPISIHQIAP